MIAQVPEPGAAGPEQPPAVPPSGQQDPQAAGPELAGPTDDEPAQLTQPLLHEAGASVQAPGPRRRF
jgi:hypothetical protein